jgi:hypothetical protein
MKREILERPFEAALIKSRRGAFGKTLSYVEGAEYIRRLNEAFEGEWSFEVVEHQVYDAEVVVLGKLTAGSVAKTAFGGSTITTNTQTGEVISLADDLKAAATDALKKAASLLGIGLSLYSGPAAETTRNNTVPAVSTGRANGNGRGYGHAPEVGGNGGNGHQQPRLTQKQLAAIWSISRALGVNGTEVRRRSMERFGVAPEQLSKSDASAFIQQLQEAMAEKGVQL